MCGEGLPSPRKGGTDNPSPTQGIKGSVGEERLSEGHSSPRTLALLRRRMVWTHAGTRFGRELSNVTPDHISFWWHQLTQALIGEKARLSRGDFSGRITTTSKSIAILYLRSFPHVFPFTQTTASGVASDPQATSVSLWPVRASYHDLPSDRPQILASSEVVLSGPRSLH